MAQKLTDIIQSKLEKWRKPRVPAAEADSTSVQPAAVPEIAEQPVIPAAPLASTADYPPPPASASELDPTGTPDQAPAAEKPAKKKNTKPQPWYRHRERW